VVINPDFIESDKDTLLPEAYCCSIIVDSWSVVIYKFYFFDLI